MDAALSFVAEYAPTPLGPDPHNGRRERVCSTCGVSLFYGPHLADCAKRAPALIRYLGLTPEIRRIESELERCTERALRRWLAAGRSTAYERGPAL